MSINRIDISSFKRNQNFYGSINLLLTIKSFDVQAIRQRYFNSKKNNKSGSVERREPSLGGVASVSLEGGELQDISLLAKLKEPRGLDFKNNAFAVSSENKVYVLTNEFQVISNPYFSFIHTVNFSPYQSQNILISSSGLDCIFEFDLKTKKFVWEWFAWENGYAIGYDSILQKEIYITRKEELAKKWQNEGKAVLLINNPSQQSLPTAQRTAFINSVNYHQTREDKIIATLFHKGQLISIDKITYSSEVILDNLVHPHGGTSSNFECMATSTNSGEIVQMSNGIEKRYFSHNLLGKPSSLKDMEWLQNSIKIDQHILTIDSNRNTFIIFNPILEMYDCIPFDPNWAVQDMTVGKLSAPQQKLLSNLSIE